MSDIFNQIETDTKTAAADGGKVVGWLKSHTTIAFVVVAIVSAIIGHLV